MKTPMQEMLEWVRVTLPMDLDTPRLIEEKVISMLEKEKEVIENAWANGRFDWGVKNNSSEDYYNKTFNTEECTFYPTMNTSSATICGACGKEKFEHKL